MIDPTALILLWLVWAEWWHRCSGIPEEMRIEQHFAVRMNPRDPNGTEALLAWAGDGLALASGFLTAREETPI